MHVVLNCGFLEIKKYWCGGGGLGHWFVLLVCCVFCGYITSHKILLLYMYNCKFYFLSLIPKTDFVGLKAACRYICVLLVLDGCSSELCAASTTFVLPTLRHAAPVVLLLHVSCVPLLQNIALYNACGRGDVSRVKELLSLGASVNYHNDARVSCWSYILH